MYTSLPDGIVIILIVVGMLFPAMLSANTLTMYEVLLHNPVAVYVVLFIVTFQVTFSPVDTVIIYWTGPHTTSLDGSDQ